MHFKGQGYLDNQQFSNCSATCSLFLFLILIASTTLETGSMQVSAWNFEFNMIDFDLPWSNEINCHSFLRKQFGGSWREVSITFVTLFVQLTISWASVDCQYTFSGYCLHEILLGPYYTIFVVHSVLRQDGIT